MKPDNKKGMGLVEMIMAIAIFAICIAGFTLLFIRTWRSNSFIIEEGTTSMTVSRAVTQLAGDLRRARQADSGEYPIKSGDNFDLIVFIDIDNDGITEKVHYFLDHSNLKRGITKPSGTPPSYPAGDQQVSVIGMYITNATNEPIFYYYNKQYPGDPSHNPLNTPVNPGDVRLIKVHLFVNIVPTRAPDNIKIETFAELRNINDY
jgi:type II secretory pathway pseudopilin PulG